MTNQSVAVARVCGSAEFPRPAQVPGRDGPSIALHDFGGGGPHLLFAHATGMHGWAWKPVADLLADRFHCWAVDLRGHGDSALAAGDDLHWSGFGRDVLAAVDAIGATDIAGVGHSLGGAALALAELAEPGTFSRLFLYEPALTVETELSPSASEDLQAAVTIAGRRRAGFASKQEALLNYARKPPMCVFQASALHAYVEHGLADSDLGAGVALKCLPTVEAQTYSMTYRHDAGRRIGDIGCPVTYAFGQQTEEAQRVSVAGLSRASGTTPSAIDGLGHFGPLQSPQLVASAIRRAFLPQAA